MHPEYQTRGAICDLPTHRGGIRNLRLSLRTRNLKLARMLVESAGDLFVSLHLNAHSHTQSMLASLLGGARLICGQIRRLRTLSLAHLQKVKSRRPSGTCDLVFASHIQLINYVVTRICGRLTLSPAP